MMHKPLDDSTITNGRGPSWKWIVGLVISILLLVIGFVVNMVRNDLENTRSQVAILSVDAVRQAQHEAFDVRIRAVESAAAENKSDHHAIQISLDEIKVILRDRK